MVLLLLVKLGVIIKENGLNAKKYINETHYVLENTHPSPLARKSFIDCEVITEVNNILKKMNKNEINWKI